MWVVHLQLTYSVNGAGEIQATHLLTNLNDTLPEIPRLGSVLVLPENFDQVEWYGRGPIENYWDRKTAAFVGRYEAKVADLYFPYIRPQENGYKTDVRWVKLTNEQGQGILIQGPPITRIWRSSQSDIRF